MYTCVFGSIVDDECFPYIEGTNRCKVHHSDTLASAGCRQQTKMQRRSLYKMGPAYSLRNETDIMLEIQSSGPVQGECGRAAAGAI